MTMIDYPTRCRILDVTGEQWRGLTLATPPVSAPHVGKEGVAEREDIILEDGTTLPGIKITLDDGTVLMGYECWWAPISADDAHDLRNTTPPWLGEPSPLTETGKPRSWLTNEETPLLSVDDVPDQIEAMIWFTRDGGYDEDDVRESPPYIDTVECCEHDFGDPHPADCVCTLQRVWRMD